jgi:putative addiction module CopG family antidote
VIVVEALALRQLRTMKASAVTRFTGATMSLELPPDIESFVEHEVSSGTYATREDLIVAAVTLLRQRQAELEQLRQDIAQGMEGEGIPAAEVFAELRGKYGSRQTSSSP